MAAELGILFMHYLLVALISYLGLILGAVLAFIAPEELKPGRKLLLLLKRALFVAIFLFFIILSGTEKVIVSVLLLVLAAVLVKYADGKVYYMVLGLLFYLSSAMMASFLVIASLIFCFGLPTGTLFVDRVFSEKKKNILVIIQRLVLHHLLFLAVALPLYFSNL